MVLGVQSRGKGKGKGKETLSGKRKVSTNHRQQQIAMRDRNVSLLAMAGIYR